MRLKIILILQAGGVLVALTAGVWTKIQPQAILDRPDFGKVDGILVSANGSSAMIDGQLVREGDTVNSVRIVRITKDAVEFSKGGLTWEQSVRQRPNPAWTTSAIPGR